MEGRSTRGKDSLQEFFEQVEQAKHILKARGGGPLSWTSFLSKFENHVTKESAQVFLEVCSRFSVPGVLCTSEAIALDTPRNTGLFKLGLIVEANEKLNGGIGTKAKHFFVVTASREERDVFGSSPEAVSKSIAGMPDLFKISQDKSTVLLKPKTPIRQESFFDCENDPQASAVHKLTCFLMLCHGSTSLNAAYEFSRCLLTKPEKDYLKTLTKKGFITFLKSMDLFLIEDDDNVSLSTLGGKPNLGARDLLEILGTKSRKKAEEVKTSKKCQLEDVEITRARVFLGDRPLMWKDFLEKLGSSQPKEYVDTFQDQFFHAAPSGFRYSKDFISTDTARNVGLIKLQLVVVLDKKLGNAQLGRVSNHFNVVASEEERKILGKNSQVLSQSLLKYPDLFCLPTTGSDKRSVGVSTHTIPFESFFELEGKRKASLIHKLKYFLNLCGGSCPMPTAYEFSRNLLLKEERDIFQSQERPLVDIIDHESGIFRVTKDGVRLRSRYIWSTELRGAQPEIEAADEEQQIEETEDQAQEEEDEADSYTERGITAERLNHVTCNKFDFTQNGASSIVQAAPKKDAAKTELPKAESPKSKPTRKELPKTETKKAQPQKVHHPGRFLTDHRVMETLRLQGYPMRWTEFQFRFLTREENPEALIANFQQRWSNRTSKTLISFSEDFVALNEAFHRNRLKLQLILQARRRSTKPSVMNIEELKEQFEEIASEEEIFQTRIGCKSMKEYLSKFSQVFIINGESVRQGWSALKFPSFFSREEHGAAISVLHKLRYFQNLCGGYCTTAFACKFLQRHIHPKQEHQLVGSEEKAMKLIRNCPTGVVAALTDGESSKQERVPSKTEAPKDVATVPRSTVPQKTDHSQFERILKKKMHPLSWTELEVLCPSHQTKKEWKDQIEALRANYLKKGSIPSFIQGEGYISLNTPFSRGFLKLCLLIRLILKSSRSCPLPKLNAQFQTIASAVERQQFYGNLLDLCFETFPSVFRLQTERNCVAPGPEMFLFQEFFRSKKRTQSEYRLHCFLEFMNVCGGRCQYNKALNFTRMMMSINYGETGTELQKTAFDRMLHACKSVHEEANMTLCTEVVYKAETSNRRSHHRVLQMISNQRKMTSNNHKETMEQPLLPPESTDSVPSVGNTPPTSGVGVANPESQQVLDPHMPHMNESRISVTLHVIDTDETLAELVTATIQDARQPIISVSCSEDTLVVVDWCGVGFIFPIPEGGMQTSGENMSAQWSCLWDLFQNVNLVSVMLDCEAVGRFLLEKLDLQLCTVFDVKDAMLFLGDRFPNNTISDLCRWLHIPGPEQVDYQFVGEIKETPHQIKVIQEAGALVPGVYSRLFRDLAGLGALSQLHERTNNKLQALYVTRMNGFLPEELKTILSGETVKAETVTPDAYLGVPQVPVTDTATSTSTQLQNGNSYLNHPENGDSPAQVNTYGDSSSEVFYSSLSNSPHSFSSDSSARLSQNGFSQFLETMNGFGSIISAGNMSSQPGQLAHSFWNTSQDSSFAQSSWATGYAGNPAQSLSSASSIPVTQRRMEQFPNSMSAQHDLSFSQPEWATETLPLSHSGTLHNGTVQNGTVLPVHRVNGQSAGDDWFSTDAENVQPGDPSEMARIMETEGSSKAVMPGKNNGSGLTEELVRHYEERNKESIDLLLNLLGEDIKTTYCSYVQGQITTQTLTEIVLDVGRRAEARFHTKNREEKPVVIPVSREPITNRDLEVIEDSDVLTGFDEENRCGIEGTLHSVRGVRNRKKKLIGLTIRVGLPLLGCADMMYDIAQSGKCTLILGYPGVGKTTLLRELARCLSDNAKKRVAVIDTCNEIAGDCDVPHFSIGSARRLQVAEHQHFTLLETAKNHSPEVIIVDQIESREDVRAVTRLSKCGIQIIAGANRDTIQSLINDDNLSQIFHVSDGSLDDIQSLDSAGALASAKLNPPFQRLVEMKETVCWYVHDLAHTFSQFKAGQPYKVQERLCIGSEDASRGADKRYVLREKVIRPTM